MSRISMRPVDDASPLIPLILAAELDVISSLQRSNPIGQLDVVRDQDCFPGRHPDDESLVRAAIAIVGQDLRDLTTTLDLDIRSVALERGRYLVCAVDAADAAGVMPSWDVAAFNGAEVRKRQENACYQELLHRP
jgi:hypothetical protein